MAPDQDLSLLIGHPQVLLRYRSVLPRVPIHALTRNATLAVISLDADLRDALHKAYGTGEWLAADAGQTGVNLTSTDMAYAARASEDGALAYVECFAQAADAVEAAALWVGGNLVLKPVALAASAAGNRPRATWPVNAALRGLGLLAAPGHDERDTLGLDMYASHAAILARALPVRV